MTLIKRLLFKLLGHHRYLRFVSWCFIFMYKTGFLKAFRKFDTHYLAGRMVSEGDTVIDIGANVGYYSTIFARKSGKTGSVISVEPIPLYREVLKNNSKRFRNIKILPYALGDRNETVKMGIPVGDATRHGLTRVISSTEAENLDLIWEVEMRKPSELFADQTGLDYLKCDIEGYEDLVLPELYGLIERFRPLIQIEFSEGSFHSISDHLKQLGYKPYQAAGRKLVQVLSYSDVSNDMIFLTEELSSKLKKILGPQNKFK